MLNVDMDSTEKELIRIARTALTIAETAQVEQLA